MFLFFLFLFPIALRAEPSPDQQCYEREFARRIHDSLCLGNAQCASQLAMQSCRPPEEQKRLGCVQLCLMRESGNLNQACFEECMAKSR